MRTKAFKLITLPALCLVIGGISGYLSMDAIDTWYRTIEKPVFTPPNAVFGPVWTVLYIMMGIAAGLVWSKGDGWENEKIKMALKLFFGQLVLNGLWSIVFFTLESPFVALFVIVALWALIVGCTWQFKKISKLAAWLMVPYLLWVSFALVLNVSIWWLNY